MARALSTPSAADDRRLSDLRSVGPATLDDLRRLGITTVKQLARASPEGVYRRLCRLDGIRHDPCVLDVLACAIAQARDPRLPARQRDWWYWSRKRKVQEAGRAQAR
jgi:hypothetical protein